jgi:hypothetical protein
VLSALAGLLLLLAGPLRSAALLLARLVLTALLLLSRVLLVWIAHNRSCLNSHDKWTIRISLSSIQITLPLVNFIASVLRS